MTATPLALYEALTSELNLEWTAGRGGAQQPLQDAGEGGLSPALVGHLNLIHPNSIQVLGTTEIRYLDELGKNARADALRGLFTGPVCMVVLADEIPVPDDIATLAEETDTPLLHTWRASPEVVSQIRYHLSNMLAAKTTLHGVFMEVMGIGVLITGGAGIGKSELAVELVTRGHRLVADDAPNFARIAPDTVNGSCPEMLRGFLEVRGLGVLNLRAMFGDGAIKHNKFLRLVVQLESMQAQGVEGFSRLQPTRDRLDVLGVSIPHTRLPVAPGRNLAVMVEAAVRDHILRMNGYDANRDFIARQAQYVQADEDGS